MTIQKGVLLILLMLLAIQHGNAQDDKRYAVSLGIGPSFPMGKFAQKTNDSSSSVNGSAKNGVAIRVEGSYHFKHSRFSLAISAHWQQNKRDNGVLEKSLKKAYPNSSHISADAKAWHVWKLLAGPFIEMPVAANGKTSLIGSLQLGMLKTNVPGFSFSVYNSGMSNPVAGGTMSDQNMPASFCFMADAGIQHHINHNIFLLLNVQLDHANPDHTFSYDPSPPSSNRVTVTQHYNITSLNVLAAIGTTF